MLTAEQHAERATGLGASDAAAALGLNPYCTPFELWQEKRGLAPPFAGNDATYWGTKLEAVVRQEYAERTGRTVRLPTATLRHPVYSIMVAHPDGVTDDGRLYEGKTARSADAWGPPGTDQIPRPYLIQVQHALLVAGLVVADVAVLIGGSDYRQYEIPADAELQALIVDGEMDFWQHVAHGTPPPIDLESPRALELLRRLYPGTNGQAIDADAALEHWRAVYDDADRLAGLYETTRANAKSHLLAAMGEAALLRFADGRSLRRAWVKRKGYTVEATEYVEARFIKSKDL